MSRLHIHISVDDMEKNIRFYSALFGNEPSVEKADYVKWDLSEPAVNFAISKRGVRQGLDHVGIQADSDEELVVIQSRLEQAGIGGRETAGCSLLLRPFQQVLDTGSAGYCLGNLPFTGHHPYL